jgi:hypothetical protein
MADDVLVNKAAAIERAIGRVREEYAGDDGNLVADHEGAGVIDRGSLKPLAAPVLT